MSVVLQNNNNLVVSKQKPLYVRPSDWLTLEDLNETEEKFVGLYGVFSGDSNYVTVLSQGDYTVDWGDGTIENFNSNVLAEHKFIYNNISNSTLTSDGYKQVIITITPQNNQHITNINFSNIPTIFSGVSVSSTWLEMKMSLNFISTFVLSSSLGTKHRYLKSFIWQGSKSFTYFGILDSFFEECVDLEYVKFFNTVTSSYNFLFFNCFNLKVVDGNFYSSTASGGGMFRNCYTLQKLPSIFFNQNNKFSTFNVGFANCYNLVDVDMSKTNLTTLISLPMSTTRSLVDPPKVNFSGVTSFVPQFNSSGIQYLTSDYFFPGSWNSMFIGSHNIMVVPSISVSNVTSYTNAFANTVGNLLKCQIFNINASINFSNRRLGKNEIVEIFNNLTDRTSTTSANINITSCYGAFYLTAADRLIATNKNWTITG